MNAAHYRGCESCRKARELRLLRPRQRAFIAGIVIADVILAALVLWR